MGAHPGGWTAARGRMEGRFFTAAGGAPPTEPQKKTVALLREMVLQLATEIEARVPDNRNKALALTALEDVQMRANRAIFDRPIEE